MLCVVFGLIEGQKDGDQADDLAKKYLAFILITN